MGDKTKHISELGQKAADVMGDAIENDKTLIVFTLLVFGVVAMFLNVENVTELIEKLATGLLGMAVGRGLR